VDAGGSTQSLLHIQQSGPTCDKTNRAFVAAVEVIADYSVGEDKQKLKFLRIFGSYKSPAEGVNFFGYDNIS